MLKAMAGWQLHSLFIVNIKGRQPTYAYVTIDLDGAVWGNLSRGMKGGRTMLKVGQDSAWFLPVEVLIVW